MARCSLQHTECSSRIRHLKQERDELERDIRSKNDLIGRAEQEASKRNAVIERKQTTIDQYNKRLDQLVTSSGVRGDDATVLSTSCVLKAKIFV